MKIVVSVNVSPNYISFSDCLSSLSCNFNRCAVRFQSFMNIACRSYLKIARVLNVFLRLHIVIKPLNKKNKHNKLFIMLTRNSINVNCKFGAHQKWELAGSLGDFGNSLNDFAKSLQLIVLNIEWVQFVLKNYEILHSV